MAVYVRPGNGRGGTATGVVVRSYGGVRIVKCDDVPKLCRHVALRRLTRMTSERCPDNNTQKHSHPVR